jgi:hypothetical protein
MISFKDHLYVMGGGEIKPPDFHSVQERRQCLDALVDIAERGDCRYDWTEKLMLKLEWIECAVGDDRL